MIRKICTRAADCLTFRRVRAHAIILAICLWGACAIDYSTPGLFDRAGNIKFQDFLQFPIVARLIANGRSSDLYNDRALADGISQIAGQTTVQLKYFYGPQVALPFLSMARLSFLTAAEIWAALSLLIYFWCVYFLARSCGPIGDHAGLVLLSAIAFPPVFHFFVRGQLSALLLLFVTAAYLALRAERKWLAGIALGFLVFKPQFFVPIAVVLLLSKAWGLFANLSISASAQLAVAYLYFGREVMRQYFTMLLHSASDPRSTELSLSSFQMHSLQSFWELLTPWPRAIWMLYFLSCLVVIASATTIWKSPSPLSLRFSVLILAAVLINPHIYIYDLLVLAPLFMLLAHWLVENPGHPCTPVLRVLLYLAFLLPLFGPLARWTHLQLSVIAFTALLWTIHRIATAVPALALADSPVV